MKVLYILLLLSTMGVCGWWLYNIYGVKPEEGKEPVQHDTSNIAIVIGGFIVAFFMLVFEITG